MIAKVPFKYLTLIYVFAQVLLNAQPGGPPMWLKDEFRKFKKGDTSYLGIWRSGSALFESELFVINKNSVAHVKFDRKSGGPVSHGYLELLISGDCFFYYDPQESVYRYIATWKDRGFMDYSKKSPLVKMAKNDLSPEERKVIGALNPVPFVLIHKDRPQVFPFQYCTTPGLEEKSDSAYYPVITYDNKWLGPSRRKPPVEDIYAEPGLRVSLDVNEYYWRKIDSGAKIRSGFYAGQTVYRSEVRSNRPVIKLINNTGETVTFNIGQSNTCACKLILVKDLKDTLVFRYRFSDSKYIKDNLCTIPPGETVEFTIARPYDFCKLNKKAGFKVDAGMRKMNEVRDTGAYMIACFSVDSSNKIGNWTGTLFSNSVFVNFE